MSNLSLARHDYELEPDSMNHVYLDHKHMGVGGDDSWSPSVHEVYPIPRQAQAWHTSNAEVQQQKSVNFLQALQTQHVCNSEHTFWLLCSEFRHSTVVSFLVSKKTGVLLLQVTSVCFADACFS